jgi:Zn-dependent membrane protease YugP
MPLFYLDPLFITAWGIGLALTVWAQFRVKSAFARFSRSGALRA